MHSPARFALPLLPFLLAAGCVAAPEPAPTPAPVPAPPPPRPNAAPDWQDRAVTAGAWRYRMVPSGSMAVFAGDLASLSCDGGQRRVVLRVSGARAGAVTIRTTSLTRTVSAAADGGIAFLPTDPLLDAMAFSRGRFTVEPAGAAALTLPAQAEIGRVIEDCRG